VRNVSVDGNGIGSGMGSAACGMPKDNSKPVLLVEAGPGHEADTVGGFLFDGMRLRNVDETSIEGLVDSRCESVCFESVLGNANPWNLDEHSTGRTFQGVNPMPGAGSPARVCAGRSRPADSEALLRMVRVRASVFIGRDRWAGAGAPFCA
jgi:hypothetical protein